MNPKTKIKVVRADLIKAMELLAIREDQENEQVLAKYEQALERFPEDVEVFCAKLKNWARHPNDYEKPRFVPDMPSKPIKQDRFNRALDYLKLGCDDTILLSAEDYHGYLDGRICR